LLKHHNQKGPRVQKFGLANLDRLADCLAVGNRERAPALAKKLIFRHCATSLTSIVTDESQGLIKISLKYSVSISKNTQHIHKLNFVLSNYFLLKLIFQTNGDTNSLKFNKNYNIAQKKENKTNTRKQIKFKRLRKINKIENGME
jgi:hypothetical protein